jgi:hypothetical protein
VVAPAEVKLALEPTQIAVGFAFAIILGVGVTETVTIVLVAHPKPLAPVKV